MSTIKYDGVPSRPEMQAAAVRSGGVVPIPPGVAHSSSGGTSRMPSTFPPSSRGRQAVPPGHCPNPPEREDLARFRQLQLYEYEQQQYEQYNQYINTNQWGCGDHRFAYYHYGNELNRMRQEYQMQQRIQQEYARRQLQGGYGGGGGVYDYGDYNQQYESRRLAFAYTSTIDAEVNCATAATDSTDNGGAVATSSSLSCAHVASVTSQHVHHQQTKQQNSSQHKLRNDNGSTTAAEAAYPTGCPVLYNFHLCENEVHFKDYVREYKMPAKSDDSNQQYESQLGVVKSMRRSRRGWVYSIQHKNDAMSDNVAEDDIAYGPNSSVIVTLVDTTFPTCPREYELEGTVMSAKPSNHNCSSSKFRYTVMLQNQNDSVTFQDNIPHHRIRYKFSLKTLQSRLKSRSTKRAIGIRTVQTNGVETPQLNVLRGVRDCFVDGVEDNDHVVDNAVVVGGSEMKFAVGRGKKRGRPKKSETDNATADNNDKGEELSKKKRGRPRKQNGRVEIEASSTKQKVGTNRKEKSIDDKSEPRDGKQTDIALTPVQSKMATQSASKGGNADHDVIELSMSETKSPDHAMGKKSRDTPTKLKVPHMYKDAATLSQPTSQNKGTGKLAKMTAEAPHSRYCKVDGCVKLGRGCSRYEGYCIAHFKEETGFIPRVVLSGIKDMELNSFPAKGLLSG
ncbi:predicted protein [Thalassiosira pseudonana CCMP1335]|uniref:Uncharacterized protein n=1 Tax=Thalassiosira pseudonana TaxID=35128 RepID=B8CEZ2_THAPS|nr:predicted protein [Thalassiosira pseudonana CCMP1335]EED88118.1 predicted protein [Thalassiosira pseudonana CCMP1335]|eukprot:scaffold7854_cov108-Alexandrium_tamarense.AAC.4